MNDQKYMELAIDLAKSARGQTAPNPTVGAVIVKDNNIVGFGAHLKAGEAHAEVNAIQMAREKAKGATVYVTLEPCSHFGKTPPCSNLLIDSGVKRVVIASTDPNPLVAGKGIERLKNAGIQVETGLLKEEADELNKDFFHYISTGLPYVTLKSATSLDGKIATSTGESQWITGQEAREDGHNYRNQHDAILVGVNTVLEDDPSLTVRLPEGGKNPIRIILDHHLRTPVEANVITDGMASTWIVTGDNPPLEKLKVLEQQGIKIIKMNDSKIKIKPLLKILGKEKIMSLYVEGGAEVNGSFIKSGWVNQIIFYIAPKIVGGKLSPTAIGGEGFQKISEVMNLTINSIEKLGSDIKVIAEPLNSTPN